MNERHADLAMVGVFLAGVAMTASVAVATRLQLVCAVIGVIGFAMATQRGAEPFSPAVRRRLRGLVLVVAAGCGVALHVSHISSGRGSCFVWPALIGLTAFTYLSLRLRIFGSSPPDPG